MGILKQRGKWMTGSEATEEVMAKQVAICLSSGMTQTAASRELGISVKRINTLSNTDVCKRVMLEVADAAVASAKSVIKSKTAGMAELVIAALRRHLREGNLNAVPIALKVLGFGEEEHKEGPTTFTVILPGGETPKTVKAEYSEIKDDNA